MVIAGIELSELKNATDNYTKILEACGFECYKVIGATGYWTEYWRNIAQKRYLRLQQGIGGVYPISIEVLGEGHDI